jgi:hypothetical protein
MGTAYVCDLCVCQELGLNDNPQNSSCIEGWRYVPIRIIDVPGLLKDAWKGVGLGNRFLSAIGQADALIHVVDASGSVDEEGKIARPGSGNPVQDFMDIELEIELWISHILDRNRHVLEKAEKDGLPEALAKTLTGIKAMLKHVEKALEESKLGGKPFADWTPQDTMEFSHQLLPVAKPTMIIANKMDLPTAEENLEKLQEYYINGLVAASSAEAELALRRADQSGLIKYTPGEEGFKVLKPDELTLEQQKAIDYIRRELYTGT